MFVDVKTSGQAFAVSARFRVVPQFVALFELLDEDLRQREHAVLQISTYTDRLLERNRGACDSVSSWPVFCSAPGRIRHTHL